MRTLWHLILLFFLLVFSAGPALARQAAASSDLESLRAELQALRQDYETRIQALEARLNSAQKTAEQASQSAQQASRRVEEVATAPVPSGGGRSGNSAFNPNIGVVFQGSAFKFSRNPDEHHVPGFPLGGEAGLDRQGIAVGETEFDINANVDDKFEAWLTMPVVVGDNGTEIEIEEAWLQTLGLPNGFTARFGRFFSAIGYLNSKHSHTWDFTDQPLPYQAFLGSQYLDDGVQVRWLAPTDMYLELGSEIMRGSNFPAAGPANSGFGAKSLFLHAGDDFDDSNSWTGGVSWLHSNADGRVSGQEQRLLAFNGHDDLLVGDFIWKWAPNGNVRQRSFKFQSEYLWRREEGNYSLADLSNTPVSRVQRGWYAQAVYKFSPQWRMGVRYDALSSNGPGTRFNDTQLQAFGGNPRRYSLMADWSNSEFSRIRVQYIHDQSGLRNFNQWALQYIYSIGAHGAHEF